MADLHKNDSHSKCAREVDADLDLKAKNDTGAHFVRPSARGQVRFGLPPLAPTPSSCDSSDQMEKLRMVITEPAAIHSPASVL
jgi:hypothetical protein